MHLPGTVGGYDDRRRVFCLESPKLGNGYLEVRQHLKEETLELLVGAVQFVDQQHRSAFVGRVYSLQQGPLDKEALGEQSGRRRIAINVSAGLQQPYLQ